MKYLDIASLATINSQLARIDAGDSVIFGRIEAYSCKTVGSDKKLYKSLEEQISQNVFSKSPSSPEAAGALSVSPFGPLSASSSRKTFIYLISTLNASYIDYDFSNASPEQFRKEPNRHMVINAINTTLAGFVDSYVSELRDKLWSIVDTEVDLQKADIYSYIPDDADPFTEEGIIWSFNYFFYNRTLKRILFFTCRSVSKAASVDSMEEIDKQSGQGGDLDISDGDESSWMFEDTPDDDARFD